MKSHNCNKQKYLFAMTIFICSLIIYISGGCSTFRETDNGVILTTGTGITFIVSRGSSPPAQSIVWSPTDENEILVTAYETPQEPAEVYILDVKTGQRNVLVHQLPAYFFEAKWLPDGKHILILAENTTKGFEPAGWWMMDTSNKSSKYFMPSSDAAWSPDGKTIAILQKATSITRIDLRLINVDTKAEEAIASYPGADFSSDISWAPDSQSVVFSLDQQGSSDLYILNMKARSVMKITENGWSREPAWSPKGNIIAFEKNSDYIANTYLHLISFGGKCEIEIPNLENVWSPTWSPDGEKLGFIGIDGIYYLEVNKVLGRDIYQNLCQ